MACREIFVAGGCYWGVQAYMDRLRGVVETEVGFANGSVENPSYRRVCEGDTGHAETVRVVYDEERLPLPVLLRLFFRIIDPTALNRQGHDIGVQYRTGVYWRDEAARETVLAALGELAGAYEAPIVVEALPLSCFYPAEESHQDYLAKNPGGYCHVPLLAMREAAKAEVLGLYDAAGNVLPGQAMLRGEDEVPEGMFRGVAEVLVRHADGSFLLMRRSPEKEVYAGCLEGSAGGSVMCGESFEQAALRELAEETGITGAALTLLAKTRGQVAWYADYTCTVDIPKDAIRLQEGETDGYRWVSREELLALAEEGKYIDSLWRRQEPFVRGLS